ncbi:hypothetical protein [Micromonospora sp. NPDC003816]|uniref:hypothetical protein n=1 Tax=Micromonospora sp. NPDC003816 TaxID=3364224 RepID=UPI0036B34357
MTDSGVRRSRAKDELRAEAVVLRSAGLSVRLNTGPTYRGCPSVESPRSRRWYWKIEGIMKGVSDGVGDAGR